MMVYHFVNCVALTFVPIYIVYFSTSLRDGAKGKSLLWVGLACTASQFIQMVLLATFIPHSAPGSFEFSQEFMKAVIGMIDILAMGVAYNLPQLRGEYSEKVLCLGIGWTLADSLLKRAAPLWLGAGSGEFTWKYVAIAIEGNLALVTFMAFARLVSRYNARDADSTIRVTVTVLALLHSTIGSGSFLVSMDEAPLFVLRVLWAGVLWMVARKFFILASRSTIKN